MKKGLFCIGLITLLLLFAYGGASAGTFLSNWGFNINSAGFSTAITINELLDVTGNSFILNTPTGAGNFTFQEWGFFTSNSHDSGSLWPWSATNELTAIVHATGSGAFNGPFTFAPGGTVSVYAGSAASSTLNYGTNTPSPVYYGANDGTLIATYSIVSGTGSVDTTGLPNGTISITLENTFLEPGTWFDSIGDDLSAGAFKFVLGFDTTNASTVTAPTTTLLTALSNFSGMTVSPSTNNLVESTNGQFRLLAVQCLTNSDCTPTNACFTAACNATTGNCDQTPTSTSANCKPTNDCFTAACNATTGACDQTPTSTSANCKPTNACFTAACNATTGACDQTPIPSCGAVGGCTLGFWKNHALTIHAWGSTASANMPYYTGELVKNVFTIPGCINSSLGNTTLYNALQFGGGPTLTDKADLLVKQAVASVLNAATSAINFPLTTSQVISDVNTALASCNATTINNLQNTLDADNSKESPFCQ